jgi:hypothetical protein
MKIHFTCRCGKRLRARPEMASRRSLCPACGAPVGIPSLTPTHRGTQPGPLTLAERLRRRRVVPPGKPPMQADTLTEEQPRTHRGTRGALGPGAGDAGPAAGAKARPEHARADLASWFGEFFDTLCLVFPAAVLAVVLTGLTAAAFFLWPRLVDLLEEPGALSQYHLALLVVPLLASGYVWAFLDGVLSAAAAGQRWRLPGPGRNLDQVLQSGLRWLACFLAGPVAPAAAVMAYWLHCGDLAILDRFILAELSVVAIGYWLLAVVAVHQGGRRFVAGPVAVAALAGRLGFRAVLLALAAAGLALAHGRFGLAALERVHLDRQAGWLMVLGGWTSAVFCAAVVVRLLGVACRRIRA